MVILRIQLNLCLILSLKGFYKYVLLGEIFKQVWKLLHEFHLAFLVATKEVLQL